ncbi:hypothetical protein PI125_g23900 [Phytophthora idaei]|nr:hypothetical protein PI125_g23900 [Phytophthora idaei]KAG3127378.1 hypothetical protein PI126_g21880 [Phytophthora idaei]
MLLTHLKISGLQEYDVIPQTNPTQFDAYCCDFGLDASAQRTELEQANGKRRHSSDQKLSTAHLEGQGTTRIDRGWVVLLGARM